MAFDWSIKPFQFTEIFEASDGRAAVYEGDGGVRTDEPDPRSGHRCVTDGANLFCYGGFNPNMAEQENVEMTQGGGGEGMDTCYPLFRELWKFNLYSRTWSLLPTRRHFPTCLASPHAVLVHARYMLVYGGTGVPFGEVNEEWLRMCDLATAKWKVIEPCGGATLPPIYGQAMTSDGGDVYMFAGTDGHHFFNHLFHISLKDCHIQQLSDGTDMANPDSSSGRYRHEIVYYKEKIYVFGGGFIMLNPVPGQPTIHNNYGFHKIDAYDVRDKKWCSIPTLGDAHGGVDQFPRARKCHSCVLYNSYVYMCGGFTGHRGMSDMWRLDLETYQWRRLDCKLPNSLYFHSAAITHEGCMLIYGGVKEGADGESRRTSDVLEVWLDVAPLKLLAWRCVSAHILQAHRHHQLDTRSLLQAGVPRDLLHYIQAA